MEQAFPKRPADNPDDEATARVTLSQLEPFFALRGTMPLQYVRAFLVAKEEGLGVLTMRSRLACPRRCS